MLTQFETLTPDEHVDTAVETLLRTSQGEFPVVDGMGRPLGVLVRNDLIRFLKQLGPATRVDQVMSGGMPTVSNRSCLDEAFRLLQEKSVPAVGVIDASDRLIGLVTSETIGKMLMLHEAMPNGAKIGPWQSSGRGAA
jgi:stage IV sporulation protein FB